MSGFFNVKRKTFRETSNYPEHVIPAEAGIQCGAPLDTGLRRCDVRESVMVRRRLIGLVMFFIAGFANLSFAAGSDSLFAATLTDTDGKPAALEQYRGKPLIVNFWARWCGPCRVEIPELAKAHDKYRKQGLVVLGIGLEDQPEAVRDFMKAYEMQYPVLLAKDKGIWLMQALGNARAGLPFTVAIDRKGEIVVRKLGVMKAADIDAAAAAVLR